MSFKQTERFRHLQKKTNTADYANFPKEQVEEPELLTFSSLTTLSSSLSIFTSKPANILRIVDSDFLILRLSSFRRKAKSPSTLPSLLPPRCQ